MEELPSELQPALVELKRDYEEFIAHPGGANGYLVFAKNRISREEVAIKFYYGEPGERRHDEPRLLAEIESPNVLKISDARNITDGWALFITKRCERDLDELISKRPSAHQAIDIALGICNGVSAIHSKSMIHRDLKPANIVLDDNVPKIADFGSVRKLSDNELDISASQHSVLYRPPESFATGRYSFKGDIHQIGLVTYQLLGGHLPYDPLQYFTEKDLQKYSTVTGNCEKSAFQDSIIRRLAEAGKLLKLDTLPPWVGNKAKRCLKEMVHPDVERRLETIAYVAAALTRIRGDTFNWRWLNDIAQLQRNDRTIELRPVQEGLYEPFQSKGGQFRRVPSVPNASLQQLVQRLR